jgi:hypothetical protein
VTGASLLAVLLGVPGKGGGIEAVLDGERRSGVPTGRASKAEAAIARGERETARVHLEAIGARFGSLSAPRIIELADSLAKQR